MQQLDGKVAVITGGGAGIGLGVARLFASEGASVVIGEIVPESGESAVESIRATGGTAEFVHMDASNKEQVENLVDVAIEKYGAIDILINNAYVPGTIMPIESKSDDEFVHAFMGDFMSALWASKRAFPKMKAQGYGRIVNMCSLNGVNAHLYSADFNAAKEALRAFSRSAAREWAEYGITVNVICPGAKTKAFELFEQQSPEMAAKASDANPMKRMGDPVSDIAPVVLFLSSPGARYTTGNTLFVDGGSHINGVDFRPNFSDS